MAGFEANPKKYIKILMHLYLGIDFGTSGARAIVIDSNGSIQAEAQSIFTYSQVDISTPKSWQTALFSLIEQIPQAVRKGIRGLSIDGTSSTVLLCNADGEPIAEPLMYNDGRGIEVIEKVKEIAPPNHTVISATSSLTKLLWLSECRDVACNVSTHTNANYLLHQADWLAFLLHGKIGISDYHNALKLGYDVENLCYPQWLQNLPLFHLLPKVIPPGTPIAEIHPNIATKLGLSPNCVVCAGTTDSIAAFLASGAKSPGEAVTSLGSTLVLKLLSNTRVDDAKYGIYSHRLGDLWLVGGASNTGGAVLRQFFTDAELATLSLDIQAEKETAFDYYPLTKPGERFPINDPQLQARLEPRPDSPVEFLHGLLESIARIEAQAYQLLQKFGANQLIRVYTAGGGAKNPAWTKIRDRHLQVPILPPLHTAAAYGAALLAMRGVTQTT